ncbi:MAG: iron-sulfur cluster insertion protein ErpA [Thermomicrobiales bacterium]
MIAPTGERRAQKEAYSMITITHEAVDQLKDFLSEQGTPEHALRVFVAPGGCSGLQYGMSIEEAEDEGDTVVTTEGVKLLVDEFSAMYIAGAEIDFVNSLMGGGFTVRNPNAVTGCACGHSFDTGLNAETAQGCGCGA